MKMARVLILCLLCAALASAGCAAPAAEQGKTVIRLSGYTSSPEEVRLMGELIQEFQSQHPGIAVRYEPIPGNYVPKLLTMLVSGSAPDVFYLDSLYFASFQSKGVLRPLNDMMSASRMSPADFHPSLMNAFMDKGVYYGIPKDFNALALFYNMDIFCQHEQPYPDDGWTWDELSRYALKMTKREKGVTRYGICLPSDDATRWLPFAFANGADIFSMDRSTSVIGSSEAVSALQFYSSFERRDHSSAAPSAVGCSGAGVAFAQGKAAMVIEGGWLAAYLREKYPKLRYGVAELPRTPSLVKNVGGYSAGGRSNLLFTVAYAIPKASLHPGEAWLLVDFLTRPENQMKISYALPSRVAVREEYLKKFPEYRAIFNATQYGKPYQFGKRGGKVIDTLGFYTQRVFLSGESTVKALSDAQNELNRLLEIQ